MDKTMTEPSAMTTPNFPCFDLSFWDSLDIDNSLEIDAVILTDDQFYASNEHFNKYLLDHIIVDSDGRKYKAVKVLPYAGWRKLIPFNAKAKVAYESLESSIGLEELRSIILNKLDTAQNQEEQKELRTEIMKAKDFQGLFGFQ